MSQHKPSVIPVIVELSPELTFLAAPKGEIARPFTGRIARGLADLVHMLGVPGRPTLEVKTSDTPLPRLFVHGSPQPFPLPLIQEVFAYVSNSGLTARRLTFSWQSEIKELMSEEKIAEFMARLVIEVAKQRPEILMSKEQAAVYFRLLTGGRPGKTSPLDFNRITEALRYLLSLGLSIANSSLVTEHLVQDGADTHDPRDLAESLVPQLRPHACRIEMEESYLHAILGVELSAGQSISINDDRVSEEVRNLFKLLSDGLFYELGIRVPDIVLAVSTGIQKNCFSIRVNHLEGIPMYGLAPDQLLVNERPDNVRKIQKAAPKVGKPGLQVAAHAQDLLQRLGITPSRQPVPEVPQPTVTALAAINPANDKEVSIVGVEDRQIIEDDGVVVWDPAGYLILALSKTLRQNAWRLFHVDNVEYELAQLHEVFPDLVSAAIEKFSVSQLSQILRELLVDQITIRDLRSILEHLLTYGYVVADPSFIVLDDRVGFSEEPKPEESQHPCHYARHVRAGLKQYMSYKLTRGRKTLPVYLIHLDLEKQIADHLAAELGNKTKTALSSEQYEAILAGIRAEVAGTPPTAIAPVLLTGPAIRAFVRQMVAPEFPNLFVVAYTELPSGVEFDPKAMISI